jgi:hypothetical protein
MRRSRGRLTLGVHKIPFLEFSPNPTELTTCSGELTKRRTESSLNVPAVNVMPVLTTGVTAIESSLFPF